MKNTLRILALILVFTTFSLFTASCMGSFALTQKLYKWNKNDIGNKWLSSLVLFIFLVLPVYGIAGLIDWIILNVIEFYSGNNPISANESTTRTAQIGDTNATLTFHDGEGINVDIKTVTADGHTRTLVVRSVDEHGLVARLVEEGQPDSLMATRKGNAGSVAQFVNGEWKYLDIEEVVDTVEMIPSAQDALAMIQ